VDTFDPSEDDRDTYRTIFELLCSRRIEDAIELATSADMYRLALLLSQLQNDDTIAEIMFEQLTLWDSQNNESIDPQLLSVYRLIGILSSLSPPSLSD
jgi:hypothetical protein